MERLASMQALNPVIRFSLVPCRHRRFEKSGYKDQKRTQNAFISQLSYLAFNLSSFSQISSRLLRLEDHSVIDQKNIDGRQLPFDMAFPVLLLSLSSSFTARSAALRGW
jgi:hypothetical protein